MYLEFRESDVSEKTLQNHRYRLDTFIEFCEVHDIENLNELDGRDIHSYRTWRGEDIKPLTLKTHLATLRVFLEFCASIDAVEDGLREKVVLPNVSAAEESKSVQLDADRARSILDFLDEYRYASRDHIIMLILAYSGIRLGTLRALDVGDWDSKALLLKIRHRPDSGTPLKNREPAERSITVSEEYGSVIDDYIRVNRVNVTDDHGREPLISSQFGRMSEGAIRETVYRLTRPCIIDQECPHDRDLADCEATQDKQARECPSSVSPHAVRRGAITRMLRDGTPEKVVSSRSNATSDILEKHYDERSERERAEIRREFLEDSL
ncbi:tyrosine-type recombinase/integrase [Halomicroarcula sp. GCM10025709]|uniref:tyrosine-type recombinase/integrase n=1 Tax=Haloarcula TaxID=2237 RepID=UPI00361B602B